MENNNKIQIFNNAEFGSVRTVDVDGVIHFVGKDVAQALGYERATKAIADHVDKEDIDEIPIQDSIGRMQKTPVITESGLYSLVLSSKLPTAKKFKHWVTSEILPSIRKHGAYMTENTLEKALTSPDFLIQLANQIKAEQEKNRQLETQIEANKPKVIFADAVSVSNTSILVGDLAKLIKQNGVEIGANRLFKWLRDNGYLISRKGSDYNSPTQKSMEMKLFEVKETVVTHSDGHTSINKTPKVTGKGQQYFVNKFLSA
ncbi:MAG: phage antirepressor [Oscillospiraceae bacterium]